MRGDRLQPPPRRESKHARAGDATKDGHLSHRLPVFPTRLIGRDDEIALVQNLLKQVDVRLLTLVGPPGIGKTRLAVEIAKTAAPHFQQRAAFVDLGAVRDSALVPHKIAQVLGVVDAPHRNTLKRLIEYLEDKRVLLVLDNFEHVSEAATQVAELLSACSGVKVLATSREPLHLTWEREVPISPLRVPELTQLPGINSLSGYSAVALFLDRARAVQSDLTLTPQNAAAIAEICVRLDGLPLAIEMAAARVKSLTPEALARRLDDQMSLAASARDVPPRHRTLQSAIAWSYDLLKPGEQALFRRLAVFAGGCTANAAMAVCGDSLDIDVIDGLSALVDKSLVRHGSQADGSSRFSMLESLREFGLDELVTAGEQVTIQRQHAVYFVDLAHQAEAHWHSSRESSWMEILEREYANFQTALSWCLSNNISLGLQAGAALAWFWSFCGHWSVGRRWLHQLVEAYGPVPDGLRAKGQWALGLLLWHQAEYVRSEEALRQSLAEYRELGDMTGIRNVLYLLRDVLQWKEEYAKADELVQEGLALSRKLNDGAGISRGLNSLAGVAINRGEYETATSSLNEALRIGQELGLERDRGHILYNLGRAAFFRGQLDRAAAFYDECLMIFQKSDSKWDIARTMVRLGDLEAHRGDVDAAAHLSEEGLVRLRELGDTRWTARPLYGLARLALRRGEHERSHTLLQQSLRLCVETGAKLEGIECLEVAAALAASVGQAALAAKLFGAIERMREAVGAPLAPVYRSQHDRKVSAVRRRLGASAFLAANAAGRAMTLEQAAAEVIALVIEPTSAHASKLPGAALSRREREVAALIAQGLTNRQIAAALFITDHTVESHVENILNKLGFNVRTQIAAWASASENRPAPGL